jgi:hypothetical protein
MQRYRYEICFMLVINQSKIFLYLPNRDIDSESGVY